MQDNVHEGAVLLLLHSDALWVEECRCHLPEADGQSARAHDRAKCATFVDDMVVTTQVKDQHVADLEELFTTIVKYRLKLNPEKCVFRVEAGKFLGFLLTERGIEANSEKCAAILAMRSPISVKEVQQWTVRMVGHVGWVRRVAWASVSRDT